MSSDEDEGDGRRYNRYESDDEGDVEGTYDEDAWNDSRKRRRGQTKEQAIYGIFGDDDDDDRDDRGAPVDYTAPVNFRSAGGTGEGGAGLGAGKEPEDMFADDDEDAPPTAGLGARGGIGSGAGLGSFASQGGAGLGFGGFSKGNTITSTVENDEEEARTTRGGLGSSGLGFGSDGTGFGGGGLGFERRRRRRGRRTGRGRAQPHGRRRERQRRRGSPAEHVRTEVRARPTFSPTFETKTFLDRHGRTDTPRAAEPWPLRSRTLSCDSARHACPRTGPATRQVQCAPSGYRVARHRIRRRLVPQDSFVYDDKPRVVVCRLNPT